MSKINEAARNYEDALRAYNDASELDDKLRVDMKAARLDFEAKIRANEETMRAAADRLSACGIALTDAVAPTETARAKTRKDWRANWQ